MTDCSLYLRISLDRTGESLGVQRQETECRALADRLGLRVVKVYTDNDISATSRKRRPGFEQLLTDHPNGGVVVVWHTDRLVRLSKELERVLDHKLTVHAVAAGTLDLSTPAGRATARTVTAWAQYEGEQKALRQKSANRQGAEAGEAYSGGRRRFGYDRNLVGEGRTQRTITHTPRPEEAEAVRDGYARLLAGQTLADVSRAWNKEGLLTVAGNRWQGTTVKQALVRPFYAGLRVYEGQEFRGEWEPLVSEDQWRAVCSLLSAPERAYKGSREPVTLLAGIAGCECGQPIYTDNSRGRRRYRCHPNKHLSRAVDAIDDEVLTLTASLLTLDGLEDALLTGAEPDSRRQALLAERRALIERRDREVPQMLAAGLSVAQVAETNRQIGARLLKLEAALEASAPDSDLALRMVMAATKAFPCVLVGWVLDLWLSMVWAPLPLEAQRAAIKSLWRVTLTRDGLRIEPTELCSTLAERVGASELVRIKAV